VDGILDVPADTRPGIAYYLAAAQELAAYGATLAAASSSDSFLLRRSSIHLLSTPPSGPLRVSAVRSESDKSLQFWHVAFEASDGCEVLDAHVLIEV
jgi:hypothetical protein